MAQRRGKAWCQVDGRERRLTLPPHPPESLSLRQDLSTKARMLQGPFCVLSPCLKTLGKGESNCHLASCRTLSGPPRTFPATQQGVSSPRAGSRSLWGLLPLRPRETSSHHFTEMALNEQDTACSRACSSKQ